MPEYDSELTHHFFTATFVEQVIAHGIWLGDHVTPTFCIIKFCQARSALGCIFEEFSLKKRFSQFAQGHRRHDRVRRVEWGDEGSLDLILDCEENLVIPRVAI
jgi:hypothetical protein